MKTLELKLKKEVLIVQPEETGNINYWVTLYSKDWDFKCLGSELTEEIASELVETYEINFYVDYNSPNHYGYCFTSLESFISAVESKGFYWLGNPIKKSYHNLYKGIYEYEPTIQNLQRLINTKKWQEAEEKTFKNPLIFVKK